MFISLKGKGFMSERVRVKKTLVPLVSYPYLLESRKSGGTPIQVA